MKAVRLGNTGIEVSRLCFGSLTIGPLQKDMQVKAGAEVIAHALEAGVTFIDTAELYGNYAHIAEALRMHASNNGKRPVIASKCYAYEASAAEKSLEKARAELDADVIDVFLLHEQESRLTLQGHMAATEYFLRQKAKGNIRAFGVSTHRVEVVEACAQLDFIDVIHPIVNRTGIGIADGTIAAMLGAIERARIAGKGVYSMKALGGGNLLGSYAESMRFALSIPFIDAIAVGMGSNAEVEAAIAFFEDPQCGAEPVARPDGALRRLHIEEWCSRCGACVKRCGQSALRMDGGRPVVDAEKCVLCGYCAADCPDFAMKVY